MKPLTASLLAATAVSTALLVGSTAWLAHRGERLFRSGDLPGAVSAWTALAKLPGEEPVARYNRGVALTRMGNYSAALPDFRAAACSGDPSLRSSSLYNIGTCRLVQSGGGKGWRSESYLRESVAALHDCLALSPSDPDAAANLAVARRRLGVTGNEAERQKTPESPRADGSRGGRGKGGEANEPDKGGTAPGKATAKDHPGGMRRPALATGQALRMLDEARGRERLRSAATSDQTAAAATVPEKDW